MKTIITTALLLTLLVAGSCKKLEDKINDVASQGSMSATINGNNYVAPSVSVSVGTGLFVVTGRSYSNDEELIIWLDGYDEVTGKYTLGSIGDDNHGEYTDNNDDGHRSVSGELDLQSTGDKSAKGTFHFTTNDGIEVKDGKFDVNWK